MIGLSHLSAAELRTRLSEALHTLAACERLGFDTRQRQEVVDSLRAEIAHRGMQPSLFGEVTP